MYSHKNIYIQYNNLSQIIMSRRTRTHMKRQPIQMGLNHHSQYSSSKTHYPHSYSILGNPIAIPTKILPLHDQQHINYLSQLNCIEHDTYIINNLTPEQISSATHINLTVTGQIINTNRTSLNKLIFFISMMCCFLFYVFRMGFIRNLIYTKYLIIQAEYVSIASFISRLCKCENLVINFQDNWFDEEKCRVLVKGIERMIESHQTELMRGNRNTVSVTLRNYCYSMGQTQKYAEQLIKLTQKYRNRVQIVFIWQQIVKVYGHKVNHQQYTDESTKLNHLESYEIGL